MQVTCIRPFGRSKRGEVVDVPDGASVSPLYFAEVDSPEGVRASLDLLMSGDAPAAPEDDDVAAADEAAHSDETARAGRPQVPLPVPAAPGDTEESA